jgi:hypothetical protein
MTARGLFRRSVTTAINRRQIGVLSRPPGTRPACKRRSAFWGVVPNFANFEVFVFLFGLFPPRIEEPGFATGGESSFYAYQQIRINHAAAFLWVSMTRPLGSGKNRQQIDVKPTILGVKSASFGLFFAILSLA